MANKTSTELIARVEAMVRDSYTIRQIMAATGLAKATVSFYRALMDVKGMNCGCGKSINHRGWCKLRYQRSPSRMKYWESRFEDKVLATPKQYDDQPGYFG